MARGVAIPQAIAIPPHILYVPVEYFIANVMASGLFSLMLQEPLIMMIVVPVLHGIMAPLYLRDPYILHVIGAWATVALQRRPSIVPTRGKRYEA